MIFSAKYLAIAFVLALVILYLTWQYALQRAAFLAGVSALIALGIAQIITLLFPRPRPYTVHAAHLMIAPNPDPSFPSDHAVFCFAIASMIWRYNKKAGAFLPGLASLVGIARVYVGIHYPLDVIGGAALGIAVSWMVDTLAAKDKVNHLFRLVLIPLHFDVGGRIRVRALT